MPLVLPGGPLFVRQVSAKSGKPGKQVADGGSATYYNAAFRSSPSPGGAACGAEAVGSPGEGSGGHDNDCQAGAQDQDPDDGDPCGRSPEGGGINTLRAGKLLQVGGMLCVRVVYTGTCYRIPLPCYQLPTVGTCKRVLQPGCRRIVSPFVRHGAPLSRVETHTTGIVCICGSDTSSAIVPFT